MLIPEALTNVVAIVQPQLQAGVTLRERVDGSARIAVDADAKLLIQMLTNLAQNATRHTACGFVELCARVDPMPHGRTVDSSGRRMVQVELVVRDSGPGLREESMMSCFNKYATSGGGWGLGLYLTKLQVTQLGGHVSVRSPWTPEHSGAEFKLTLPLLLTEAADQHPIPRSLPLPTKFMDGVKVRPFRSTSSVAAASHHSAAALLVHLLPFWSLPFWSTHSARRQHPRIPWSSSQPSFQPRPARCLWPTISASIE